MSDMQLHPRTANTLKSQENPLPQLLQTPSGLALLELQGTINLPARDEEEYASVTRDGESSTQETAIGRLVFPDYDPKNAADTSWMKCVYMYVGRHQRLTGQVKKLPKAIAIIRKRYTISADNMEVDGDGDEEPERADELEVVEIVKYKIIFSTRPEPVGATIAIVGQ